MSSLHGWAAVVALAAAVACGGCVARASTAAPVGYAELRYGATYGYYPHAVYQGHDVFYIQGRWRFRTRDGWASYPVEPEPLYRYRTTIRQAPPAHPYQQGPTPVQRGPAPPGLRVR